VARIKNPGSKPGTTVTKQNPEVDPVAVWEQGFKPQPTLAEQLAASLEPEDQEIAVPGQTETHQYGEDPEPELEPGAPEPDEAFAPKVTELGHLEVFAEPDPADAQVIPLNVVPVLPPYDEAAVPVQVCANSHESPAGAKFCMECGEGLSPAAMDTPVPPREWTCARGHLIAWEGKFCMECGDQRPDLKAPVAGAGALAELAARPVPYEMLSPAERAERDRMHAAALREGSRDRPLVFEPPSGTRPVLVFHIVKSGWTFAGNVWMRGQEIKLEEGSPRWQEAQRFIHWSDQEQVDSYGCVRWKLGPWPFRTSYADGAGSFQKLGGLDGKGQVTGPTEEQLAQADEAERRRDGGVPRPMYA